MGTPFSLGFVRATTTGTMSLPLVPDVEEFDTFDALLWVYGFESPTSPNFACRLSTSMYNTSSTSSWDSIVNWTSISTGNYTELKTVSSRLLKYLRWEVTTFSGASAVSFRIDGMMRTYGRSRAGWRAPRPAVKKSCGCSGCASGSKIHTAMPSIGMSK